MTPQLSRRLFLAGGTAALVAACGSGNDDDSSSSASTSAAVDVPEIDPFLAGQFPDGFRAPSVFVPGVPQRAPLVIIGSDGLPLRSDAPDAIEVELQIGDAAPETVGVRRRGVGIPTPYYPLLFTADEPTTITAKTLYQSNPLEMQFTVVDPTEVDLVQVGDPLRPVDTPTFEDARGVDPICTRVPEACPYHEETLTEALSADGPVAFIVSTPAFCQTDVCGPTLELLIEAAADFPDVRIVHAEPWISAEVLLEPDGSTPAVGTYGLTFEPMLLVAGSDKVATARLDWAFDADEIREALTTAV